MRALMETTEAVDFVSLLLCRGERLELTAAEGLPELLSRPPVMKVGEGFAGTVAARREPLFLRDASNDPLVTVPQKRQSGLRALYGVPLLHEDRVIGVAEMGSRTSYEFSPTDRLLFRTMCQRVSVLLVQAQLVERERVARQQAEDAAARSQFLARASEVLGSALKPEVALRQVTALAVPTLGDWMTIDLAAPDGSLEHAAEAHGETQRKSQLRELQEAYPADLTRSPTGRMLRAGRTLLAPTMSDAQLRQIDRDEHHLRLLQSLEIGSLIGVPVNVRARAGRSNPPTSRWWSSWPAFWGCPWRTSGCGRSRTRNASACGGCLGGLPVAVTVTVIEARRLSVVEANEAFERIAGRKAVPGQQLEAFADMRMLRADGSVVSTEQWPLMRALKKGEEVRSEELVLERLDGGRLWLLVSASPLRDEQGEISGAVLALMDVSDQKRSEAFEQNLTAIVGHDLRNPLQAVNLTTHLLLRRTDLPDEARKAVQRIHNSTDRMSQIVAKVLDFTRVQAGGGLPVEREQVDLCALLARLKDEFDATHPGRLQLECPAAGLTALLDPDRMAQVLGNLVGNALAHGAEERPIRLGARKWRDELELTVHNEGAPIPPELLPSLFDPFVRAKRSGAGGLGLGLYIADHLVRAHGGRIHVSSTERDGTIFAVRLPVSAVERP
jgi:PAS domain S-box-containing protein